MDHDGYALDAAVTGDGADRVLRLNLAGAIDMDACADLSGELVEAVQAGDAARVVIDLDRTTFIDSHCVAMLVASFDAARQAGRGFALVRAHGVVRRVLEVSGLTTLLGGDRGRAG